MSIQPPQTDEPAESPVRTGTAKRSSRRTSDYRLRGLDLEAQAFVEAPSTRGVLNKHPSRRRRRRRLVLQWLVVFAVIAGVAVLLRATVVQPFTVSSASMLPTLQPGTDVLVGKSSLLTGPVKAGDIVVFHKPAGISCSSGSDNSHDLVERVIGLPGQTIRSSRGSIYIDGHRLAEAGWYNPPFGEIGPTRIARTEIPAGNYFVMGDNRTDTCDSRRFGPIGKSLVVGTVVGTIVRNGHPYVHFL